MVVPSLGIDCDQGTLTERLLRIVWQRLPPAEAEAATCPKAIFRDNAGPIRYTIAPADSYRSSKYLQGFCFRYYSLKSGRFTHGRELGGPSVGGVGTQATRDLTGSAFFIGTTGINATGSACQ